MDTLKKIEELVKSYGFCEEDEEALLLIIHREMDNNRAARGDVQ